MTKKELEKRKWCIIDGDMVEEIEKIYPAEDKKDMVMIDLKDQSYRPGIILYDWCTFETELDALEVLRDNVMNHLNNINKRIAELEEMDNDQR